MGQRPCRPRQGAPTRPKGQSDSAETVPQFWQRHVHSSGTPMLQQTMPSLRAPPGNASELLSMLHEFGLLCADAKTPPF
jgi:hypothetical protein